MSLNKVMIIGRLGQDPELKYTPGGAAVCNFSIATSESWTDKAGQKQEKTEWHRIVVWGKLAELCNQYLGKGRQAFVEGKLQTRAWEDKEGQKRYTTEIMANTVQFLDSKQAGSTGAAIADKSSQASEATTSNPGYNIESSDSFASDDIPF